MRLKDVINDILNEMAQCDSYFENNNQYYRVLNDKLSNVLKEEVYSNIKSKSNRNDKHNQSININILKQMTTKKSQLYTFPVTRTGESNEAELEYLIKTIKPNKAMQRANEFYNAMKSVLVEVYKDRKNKLKWRAIPNDRYYLWTNDKANPTEAKVVVKVMDTIEIPCDDDRNQMQEVTLYYVYSEDEFMAIDNKGNIHSEYMGDTESEFFGKNPLGFLPFVHVSQDQEHLNPLSDEDTLNTILQINDIMTDSKVATYHQSTPMVVATNIDKKNSKIERNPDSLIVLNTKPGSNLTPDIKVIPSALDTDKSTSLAKEILGMLLHAHGLVSKDGSANMNKSGLSQMIENTDTTEVRKTQIQDFEPAEEDLWMITAMYYNWLLDNRMADMPKKAPKNRFPEEYEVDVEFSTPSTILEERKELEDGEKETDEVTVEGKEESSEDKE